MKVRTVEVSPGVFVPVVDDGEVAAEPLSEATPWPEDVSRMVAYVFRDPEDPQT